MRVRINLFKDRIEVYQPDGPDVYVRQVLFPVGHEPTLAEIIKTINRETPRQTGEVMDMTHPRELLDAYAAEYLDAEGECAHDCDDSRSDAAPKAFGALRAVLDLHRPYSPPAGKKWVSGGHEPHCQGCSNGNPFEDDDWPCETVQVLTEALTGPDNAEDEDD